MREPQSIGVARLIPFPVAFLLCFLSIVVLRAHTQEADGKQTAQTEPQAAQRKNIPIFGNADEFAVTGNLEYYEPWPGFNRLNRDISLQIASIALVAHMQQGWEFRFNGLALRAQGMRTLADVGPTSPNPPHVTSNALALGGGPMARWNFLQFSRLRSFVDAEGDLILSNRPFPEGGTIYNFFLRAGGGIGLRITDSYWVESAFRFAHISNGTCFCAGNPHWNGRGLTIGLRRSFRREPRSSGKPLFAIFQAADERAWITNAEYYKALPGSSLASQSFDVRVMRISRAWHFPARLEFQLGGMFQTNRGVAGFGPLLRWNFVEDGSWRLFVDGGSDFIQTGSPAFIIPTGTVGYNFSLRGGGGANIRLRQSYWLDTGYRWVHITSGFGPRADNVLPWSGSGLSLGLRHTFR